MKTICEMTCEELEKAAHSANVNDIFHIHDRLKITLKNGYEAVCEVIGINHEGEGVTFNFVDLYDSRCMNEDFTNAGGWAKSALRKWLNTEFFDLFPDEWKAIIKESIKKTANGGSVKCKIGETKDKIFIPSEVEVWGTTYYSREGEGKQYEGFKDWHKRIKGYKDSEYGRWWWLRSPCSGNANFFCVVYDSGYYYGSSANNGIGVSPCFAI